MTSPLFVAPRSVGEASAVLARYGGEARPIAGGTAIALLLHQRLFEPAVLVGLGGIPELHGIHETRTTIEIGAMTTLRDVECDPTVRRALPALASAVHQVASVRVRNQATLGGNLAHADPALDPPPMLMALDASVVLEGPRGARQVPLDRFYVDLFETVLTENELLTTVVIPRPSATSRSAFMKFLPRTVDDFATVSVAVRVEPARDGTVDDVRIALGAAGSIPFRAVAAEAALRGRRLDPAVIEDVATLARDASEPLPDVRGSTAYKREMIRVWVGRTLADLAGAIALA